MSRMPRRHGGRGRPDTRAATVPLKVNRFNTLNNEVTRRSDLGSSSPPTAVRNSPGVAA